MSIDDTPYGSALHYWSRADAITEADVLAAALTNPNGQPLTDERLARMRPMPRARTIRAEPDQPARAYLKASAGDPAGAQRALHAAPA
jgi:hypothetical protein